MTTKLPLIFGSDGDININSPFINQTTSAILLNQTLSLHGTNGTTNLNDKINLINAQKMHHMYGVLAAITSTWFGASVFIFIRKARGNLIFDGYHSKTFVIIMLAIITRIFLNNLNYQLKLILFIILALEYS